MSNISNNTKTFSKLFLIVIPNLLAGLVFGLAMSSNTSTTQAEANSWINSGSNMYSGVTGNVGIGTSNPGTKFVVANPASNGDFSNVEFASSGSGQLRMVGWGNGWNINAQNDGKSLFLNRDAGPNSNLYLGRAGKEIFVSGNTGNVGIGTASPQSKLDIVAPNAPQSSALNLIVPSGTAVGDGAAISFLHNGSERGYRIYEKAIDTHKGELRFASGNASGYTDRVVFDQTGARFGDYAYIGSDVPGGYYQDAGNGAYRTIGTDGTRGFFFQNYGGQSTTMYIGLTGNYSGKVGIGTLTPSSTLSIGDSDTGLNWLSDGNLDVMSNGAAKVRLESDGDVCIGACN